MQVGIIILHWNSRQDTAQCIQSVLKLQDVHCQVIVVNNNPRDDGAWLREYQPAIRVVTTGKNLGYAGGNNRGIEHALANGCDYVWLLNDDTTAAPDSLARLMTVALSDPRAGFLGPVVYTREDPQRILSAGVLVRDLSQPQHRHLGEIDNGQLDGMAEVDYISGSALLVSRAAIEQVGMLDEEFFAYHEDTEWCLRGKRAGFRVLIVPGARVWHPDTRQRDENSPSVTYFIARNSLLLAKRLHLGPGATLRLLGRYARTLASWTLRPKWKHKHAQRDALARALWDYGRNKFGPMERV
jgi:GT2 family glycosyltransferase